VSAIASEHDDVAGTKRGPNTIFCFTLDGVRFCHFGDFGQAELRVEQERAIWEFDQIRLWDGGADGVATTLGDNTLFAVSGLGVLVRLGVIVGLIAGLRHFAFFSTVTFALAVVPATVLLLGYEMKLMAGGVGRELRLPVASKTNPGPEIHREVVP